VTGTPPETGVTPEDGSDEISVDAFRRAQAEAKKYRLELKEARDRLKARDEQDLTETERMERRGKDIEAKEAAMALRERAAEVREAAVAAGATKPEAIARLVDPDEEIGRAITRLKRELPELFLTRGGAGTANGGSHGSGHSPSPSEAMDAYIRGQLRR
jgi:hypothetical protein